MGHLCSKVTVATPRYKKKTWECATADLSSQLHRGKFSPLYDLKGGNGFPFRTRDNKDFIKVVLKSVSNSATLVIFNLRKLNQEFEKQKYIMLPEKIIETKFAYHIYYPYVEQDLISFVGLHEITPNGRDAILTQIKAAIQFLHRNEYVHRDIKPENILMLDNKPILCDLDHASNADVFFPRGTKHYMPSKHIMRSLIKTDSLNTSEKSRWLDCYAFGKTIAMVIIYTSDEASYDNLFQKWFQKTQVSISNVYIDKYEFGLKTTWWNQVFNFCDTNEKFIFDNTYTLYTIND